jgi:hypothetical protein
MDTFQFWLKLENNNRHLIWRPTHASVHGICFGESQARHPLTQLCKESSVMMSSPTDRCQTLQSHTGHWHQATLTSPVSSFVMVMFWQNKQLSITIFTLIIEHSWIKKFRGNNRADVPEVLCYAYISQLVKFMLLTFVILLPKNTSSTVNKNKKLCLPCQHGVKENTQRPDITGCIITLSL